MLVCPLINELKVCGLIQALSMMMSVPCTTHENEFPAIHTWYCEQSLSAGAKSLHADADWADSIAPSDVYLVSTSIHTSSRQCSDQANA
eukprot:scaffold104053_cov18-Prasinocladus_malaysianus.AAC.1